MLNGGVRRPRIESIRLLVNLTEVCNYQRAGVAVAGVRDSRSVSCDGRFVQAEQRAV
jgi:hypothetical protein